MATEILSVAEMYRADALAAQRGIPGVRLMEAAGFAVSLEVRKRFPACRVAILCGPGNNGGDGFVAARWLSRAGYAVRVGLLGDKAALKGDAKVMADLWRGTIEPLAEDVLTRADVVVDALFGAGLTRPLAGEASVLLTEVTRRTLPVIAVDLPSGIHGDSGALLGEPPQALATVTFFRKKPAHVLLPSRVLCGTVVVADIGIPMRVLEDISPQTAENHPELWQDRLPRLREEGHKYNRGHLVVIGGAAMTGAARLVAAAARRAGAGLVSLLAPPEALALYRGAEPGVIVSALDTFPDVLGDPRKNALVLGPGGETGEDMRTHVLDALAAKKACVIDAGALTAFASSPEILFQALDERSLLTPHDGEFARLFPALQGNRLERARQAAERSGAVVLLKGGDTVIAHPDGRAVVNTHAPPWLATAGSGDVLAGMAGGAMAAGMETFDAACVAAWRHGQGGKPGMIAEDLLLLK